MVQQKKQYQMAKEAAQACAAHIGKTVSADSDILLFYSGGSALQVLPYLTDFLQPTVTFCAVDERFDQFQSNFVRLQNDYSDFYQRALAAGCTCIDTSPHLQDQYQMADWLERELASKIDNPNSQIVTLLGMGEDGHIAGILPFAHDKQTFDQLFVETDRSVVGYTASGNIHPKRFTLSYRGLEHSTEIVLFAAGEKKNRVLADVETAAVVLSEQPVKYLFTTQIPVTIFTSSL